MELRQMLCNEDSKILDVLKIINKNIKGTAFIVDNQEILKGIVTDGDIRRALLAGYQLDTKISMILNSEYVFGTTTESHESLLSKINTAIKILPIINEIGQVVDFFECRTDLTIPVSFPYLKGNEYKYLTDAFLSTWISSTGKYINHFEESFSEFSDCNFGVAVSNGTVSLHLALKALGIGEGDEVIVPDLTFAATINAVIHARATPIIVDIEADSWCINPTEVEKAITEKTKAIIPVHLYGQPCDMDSIMYIANKYNLYVIEDCAEAHGATYKGKKVGSFGQIGCYSFFANKIITTGEGGMCVTNNKDLNERLRLLRDHGMSKEKKYWHTDIGFNYRMTNLQAAIGVAQLEKIEDILSERLSIEKTYQGYFKGIEDINFQKELSNRKKVVWLYSVLVNGEKRDDILKSLKKNGYDARPFFYPLSEMPIYKQYIFSNENSVQISKRGINLPTYIGISNNIIKEVSKIIKGERELFD